MIIEIITYYKLCSWDFSKNILIEKRIPEFGRGDIHHNVEFSLHKTLKEATIYLPRDGKSITAKGLGIAAKTGVARLTGQQLLSSKSLLRNSAVMAKYEEHVVVANVLNIDADQLRILIANLSLIPVAIFEGRPRARNSH